MVGPDLSIFGKFKTKADFDRAEEEFQLKRQVAQRLRADNTPAAIRIANEVQQRIKAGDIEGANLILQSGKIFDKGINPYGVPEAGQMPVDGAMGSPPVPVLAPQAIPGYGNAVGGIAATKKGMEQDAKNASDLGYSTPIKEAEKRGTLNAEREGVVENKIKQAEDNLSIINEILAPDDSGRSVLDKATGSGIGAGIAAGKKFFGVSDESTQANADLSIYGGRLLSNVPRMEGPQSDADRKSYEEQAGKIADPSIPAQDKKSALAAIRKLSEKYANQQNQAPSLYERGKQEFEAKRASKTVRRFNPATGRIE